MKLNKNTKITIAVCVLLVFIVYIALYILPGRDFITRYKYRYNSTQTYAQPSSQPETSDDGLLRPVYAKGLPDGTHAAVFPRVELLSGVLSQTSWGERYGPAGKGNIYYIELKDYFSKYKDHKAVQKAEKLLDLSQSNLLYIVLRLNEIPSMELLADNSELNDLKSIKKEDINEFGSALADLSKEMDFPKFFEAHRAEYQKYVDESVKGFDSVKIITWLDNFYGEVYKKADYYTVFVPALFSAGGYSIRVTDNNGAVTSYQMVLPNKRDGDEVKFPRGLELELLTIHEWGHAYVTPSLKANNGLISKYQINKLYKPMGGNMPFELYNDFNLFLNEQVLRGAVAIACREQYGELAYWNNVRKHKNSGFYLTDFTVKQFEYYRKNRDKYKKFDEFIPYLYEQYSKNMDSLIKQAK